MRRNKKTAAILTDDALREAANEYVKAWESRLESAEDMPEETFSEDFQEKMQALLTLDAKTEQKRTGRRPYSMRFARAAACLVMALCLWLGVDTTARAAVVSGVTHLFDSAKWGFREASREALLPWNYAGTALKAGENGPADMCLAAVENGEGAWNRTAIYLLDAEGKHIVGAGGGAEGWTMPLDFCGEAFKIGRDISGTPYFYVLGKDALYAVRTPGEDHDMLGRVFRPAQEDIFRAALPDGRNGAEFEALLVREGTALLIDEQGESLYLEGVPKLSGNSLPGEGTAAPALKALENSRYAAYDRKVTADGGKFSVEQDAIRWDLDLPQCEARVVDTLITAKGRDLLLLVKDLTAEPSEETHLTLRRYAEDGSLKAVSALDDRDFCCETGTPVLLLSGSSCLAAAPEKEGLYLFSLTVGEDRLHQQEDPEDLTGEETAILGGKVLPLQNGRKLSADLRPVLADLDQDGSAELIYLRQNRYKQADDGLEVMIDGLPAGFTHFLTGKSLSGGITQEDAGSFSEDAGYRMSLASTDGRSISLLLGTDGHTYALQILKNTNESRAHKLYAAMRLRGTGKKMKDFVPCLSPEDYMAAGWQVAPADGDAMDLDGDGRKEILHVRAVAAEAAPLDTEIALSHETLGEGGYAVIGKPEGQESIPIRYPFDRLIYASHKDGGYELQGIVKEAGGESITHFRPEQTENGCVLREYSIK